MNVTLDDLWRAKNIAELTGLSEKTVHNHTVRRKDFPRPLQTPRGRRWLRDEVTAWWYSKHVREQ